MLALAPQLVGCRDGAAPRPEPFRLEQVRPRRDQRQGVFLNEALVLHFSEAVDAKSVTRESILVRAVESGELAQGGFEVEGDHVRFSPALGRRRDLSDGGLLPGTRYEVELLGFPAPDGLRSQTGRVLERSVRFTFETVELAEPRGQLYEDHSPLVGAPLLPESRRFERGGALILRCAEPLDPSTLVDGEFLLRSGGSLSDIIPLDPQLLENSHDRGARLELKPRRRLAAGRYYLPLNLDVSLRDFGGNVVWYAAAPGAEEIEVYDRSEVRPEFVQSFTSTDLSLPFAIPGIDGTATWAGDGRVTFRWPAAAGSGAEGEVALGGTEGRRDLHATRLSLAEGERCALLSAPGAVVLRAQGLMRISGELIRSCGPSAGLTHRPGEALSEWLTRTLEEESTCTVLIAGGDLVIDGALDVEGPLLLVAGGRLRVSGEIKAQARELWFLGEGGGPSLRSADRIELELDEPYLNPLAAPLTLALVSGPMPPEGGVSRWTGAEVELLSGRGAARVSYMPEDFRPQAPLDEWGIVQDPSELLSTDALRLFIELEMGPPLLAGERWEPPFVDEVRLFWEAQAR